MGLSNDIEQQRSNEVKSLRQWVGWGLTGSFVLHGLSLSWTVRDPWQVKPRPTEVVIVPRPSPPEAKPSPVPSPRIEPRVEPEINNQPLPEPIQPLQRIVAASQILPPGVLPEGEADAERDESPLVGSGLSEGDGGFSEGIGLNRSNSAIRGSGGGERRGVEGGVPGGIIAPPIVTAPSPPAVVEEPAPQPEFSNPRLAVCRRCPSPEYPRSALQTGAEGRVQMAVDLDGQGRVVGLRLANSSGNPALDRAVLETVRERWRFENVRGGANNIPVEVYMTVDESELNQRAQDWGDRTAIEIPDAGFAAPSTEPNAAPLSQPLPSPESPQTATESVSPPLPEPIPPSIPEPSAESVEAPSEPPPELLPELPPEPEVEMAPEPEPEAAIVPETEVIFPEPEIETIAPNVAPQE